jgi:hypothetical protein
MAAPALKNYLKKKELMLIGKINLWVACSGAVIFSLASMDLMGDMWGFFYYAIICLAGGCLMLAAGNLFGAMVCGMLILLKRKKSALARAFLLFGIGWLVAVLCCRPLMLAFYSLAD